MRLVIALSLLLAFSLVAAVLLYSLAAHRRTRSGATGSICRTSAEDASAMAAIVAASTAASSSAASCSSSAGSSCS